MWECLTYTVHSVRPRTIFDEDEESLTELSNTNDDDYVNMIKYGQLFELRRKSSLAQCPTSMTNEASSLYLFQNIERILHTMDIDDDFALPAIKKTEGCKRSISRQKKIEVSMIFGQVLLLTFFFIYRGRKFYHDFKSKRSSFFGARFRKVV